MIRVALGIEYDGSCFKGWQTQSGVRTVQETLEQALSKVADHSISVICAGRTDSGVHGLEQVVHFDTTANRLPRSWVFGTNCYLPDDVNVLWATPIDHSFHARFSAIQRHYRYIILNRSVRSAVHAKQMTWFYPPLEITRMQEAAQFLIGEHDFSSFRAKDCQSKSPIRNLTRLGVSRHGEQVWIEVSANAFLQHMVRNISGVLMTIGCGKAEPNWAKQVLERRNRTASGITAPPDGLYLQSVDYKEDFEKILQNLKSPSNRVNVYI
jgi:tRNA pseudouridine38-40 synthase